MYIPCTYLAIIDTGLILLSIVCEVGVEVYLLTVDMDGRNVPDIRLAGPKPGVCIVSST